jgi:serine/threonine-protein kinase HipA
MCGKLSGHTLQDALDLARTCGIRRAPDIISRVADAIGGFRTLATRYGVGEVWTGAVESTLQANLQAWGLTSEPRARVDIEVGGTLYCDVHVERTYRGNFHLYATLGERVLRYVIGPSKAEYRLLEQVGPFRLSEAQLKSLLERFLVSGKGGL